MPDFIRLAEPADSEIVSLDTYRHDVYGSAVCVGPDLLELAQEGDEFTDFESVFERVELQVDGEARQIDEKHTFSGGTLTEVLVDGEVYAVLGGPYLVCWSAPPTAGTHHAEFSFRQTSGDVHRHTWEFTIVED